MGVEAVQVQVVVVVAGVAAAAVQERVVHACQERLAFWCLEKPRVHMYLDCLYQFSMVIPTM